MTTHTPRDRALSSLPFLRGTCTRLAQLVTDRERKSAPAEVDRVNLRAAERELAMATAHAERVTLPAALRIELTRIDAERDADTDSLGRVYRATVRNARRRAIRDVLESVEHRRPLGVTPEAAAPNKEIT